MDDEEKSPKEIQVNNTLKTQAVKIRGVYLSTFPKTSTGILSIVLQQAPCHNHYSTSKHTRKMAVQDPPLHVCWLSLFLSLSPPGVFQAATTFLLKADMKLFRFPVFADLTDFVSSGIIGGSGIFGVAVMVDRRLASLAVGPWPSNS